MKNKGVVISLVVLALLGLGAYTQLTLFVVPPIGALPEGKTVVIWRLSKTNFIDSPDAMCERSQAGVSLLCRGMMLSGVVNKSNIIMRLPYSETLYLASTNGKQYTR